MDGTKFTPTNLEVSVQEEMPEKKTTEKDKLDAWPLQERAQPLPDSSLKRKGPCSITIKM